MSRSAQWELLDSPPLAAKHGTPPNLWPRSRVSPTQGSPVWWILQLLLLLGSPLNLPLALWLNPDRLRPPPGLLHLTQWEILGRDSVMAGASDATSDAGTEYRSEHPCLSVASGVERSRNNQHGCYKGSTWEEILGSSQRTAGQCGGGVAIILIKPGRVDGSHPLTLGCGRAWRSSNPVTLTVHVAVQFEDPRVPDSVRCVKRTGGRRGCHATSQSTRQATSCTTSFQQRG